VLLCGGLAATEEKKNDEERDGEDEMESGLSGGLGNALEGDDCWDIQAEESTVGRCASRTVRTLRPPKLEESSIC
jgi:hypothetical protein